jgi:hypothetical protein
MDLNEIKRSEEMLLSELGLDRMGGGQHCPFHDDKHGSFSVYQNAGGEVRWKCHAGCGSGSIVDAVKLRRGLPSISAAIAALGGDLGVKVKKPPVETHFESDRAENLIANAHRLLLSRPDLQAQWMVQKRGISLDVAKKYRIGLLENASFREWPQWVFPMAWTLPITDAEGKLLGVKLHFEVKPGDFEGKNLWAPLLKAADGSKPKQPCMTLWPPPENHPDCGIMLCPGELKALGFESIGLPASSITCGESGKMTRDMVERLKGRHILLAYDYDKTGRKWALMVRSQLCEAKILVDTFRGGDITALSPLPSALSPLPSALSPLPSALSPLPSPLAPEAPAASPGGPPGVNPGLEAELLAEVEKAQPAPQETILRPASGNLLADAESEFQAFCTKNTLDKELARLRQEGHRVSGTATLDDVRTIRLLDTVDRRLGRPPEIPKEWTGEEQALIRFMMDDLVLPDAPWKMNRGTTVRDNHSYWSHMLEAVSHGPGGPAARLGTIQRDLAILREDRR